MDKQDRKLIKKHKSRFEELMSQEYKTLAEAMNRRYDFFKKLREFKEKHGYIPKEHEKQWDEFIVKDGGFLWHEQKKAVATLKKAAGIHALRRLKAEIENDK